MRLNEEGKMTRKFKNFKEKSELELRKNFISKEINIVKEGIQQ